MASEVASWVKNLPAMQEMQVPSLGREEGMATHSSVLAWRIPGAVWGYSDFPFSVIVTWGIPPSPNLWKFLKI